MRNEKALPATRLDTPTGQARVSDESAENVRGRRRRVNKRAPPAGIPGGATNSTKGEFIMRA